MSRPFSLLLLAISLPFAGCGTSPNEAVPTVDDALPRDTVPEAAALPPILPVDHPLDTEDAVLADAPFELRVDAAERYSVGEEGSFSLSVTPREGYEVTERYPYRVSVRAPNGLGVTTSELARSDASALSAEEARFDVRFTPRAAGAHRCVVDVDFSVCSDSGCVPLQRRLAIEVTTS